jgi:hypothetical protein
MATHLIEKGELTSSGMRKLVLHIQDADNRWREEAFGEVPEAEVENRIDDLLRDGRISGRWPPRPQTKPIP